jgi:predicted RNA methylase
MSTENASFDADLSEPDLGYGAGTGRDAAGFAAMGHTVTAVEPTAEFRAAAAVDELCRNWRR